MLFYLILSARGCGAFEVANQKTNQKKRIYIIVQWSPTRALLQNTEVVH